MNELLGGCFSILSGNLGSAFPSSGGGTTPGTPEPAVDALVTDGGDSFVTDSGDRLVIG